MMAISVQGQKLNSTAPDYCKPIKTTKVDIRT